MRVLVTGANGLLGANLIAELLNQKYQVRGLLRDKKKFLLPDTNVELMEGELTNPKDLEKAVKGCDYVIHSAATTSQNLLTYKEYMDINVKATENIWKASVHQKVKRFIYIGTANVFSYGNKEKPGVENTNILPPFSRTFYSCSKLEAQISILKAAKAPGVPEAVSLNPTFMIGPLDSKPSSGRIILMGYRKKIIFYPPGGKNFIDVRDVAKAVCRALHQGTSGEAYILANENLTYKEFFQKLNQTTHSKSLLVKVPRFMLWTLGLFGSLLRFFGIRIDLSLPNVKTLFVHSYYSNQKAVRDLELPLTPISEAIMDAVTWFRGKDMIK